MLNILLLVPRLRQVAAWTAKLAAGFDPQNYWQYGTVFRQLNPVINGQPLFTIDRGYTTWNQDDYEPRHFTQALAASFAQRDAQLGAITTPRDIWALGRILCFETQLTTHDGVAIAESNCLVDESDVPPLDTWFYFDTSPGLLRPQLLCWIPRQFEQLMQAAIDVEMMDSYFWLDEASPLIHQEIVAAMTI